MRHVALCFAAALSSVEGAAHGAAKTCKTPEDIALLDMPNTVLNVPCYVTAMTHCTGYPICCVNPGVCEYHGGTLSTNHVYYEGGCSPEIFARGGTPAAAGCNGHQGECLINAVEAVGGQPKNGNMTIPDAETRARIDSDDAKLQPCVTWDVVEFAFEFNTLLSDFSGHHNTAGDVCETAVSEASGVHKKFITKVVTPPPPAASHGRRLGGHDTPSPVDPDAPPEEMQKVTLHFRIDGYGTTAAAITTGMDAAFGDTATAQATLSDAGYDTTVTGVTDVISCPIVDGLAMCANTLPNQDDGLSTGALVAIIAGGVVAALLVLAFVKLVLFKKPANDGAAYGGKGGAA